MLRTLTSRGHVIEFVDHREVIDPDGTPFHQFTFAVDGQVCKPWEIPRAHRARFASDEQFEDYLARNAVTFAWSEYNR